jgi:hypothetical protein
MELAETNAQDGIKIYVDGVRVDDSTASGGTYVAMGNKTTPVYIGALNTSYANGNIDEVSVYDKALTFEEITNISIAPTDLTPLNPIAWYRMGDKATYDGTNWTLIDQGSEGNDATSVNMDEIDRVEDTP